MTDSDAGRNSFRHTRGKRWGKTEFLQGALDLLILQTRALGPNHGWGIDEPAGSAVYVPWLTRPFGSAYLVARTAGDPMRLAPEIRRIARDRIRRCPCRKCCRWKT